MKLRVKTMNESSCVDCKDRKVGCHSNCEKYQEWKRSVEEQNQQRRASLKKKNDGYYHK